jgi:hypothetical protein
MCLSQCDAELRYQTARTLNQARDAKHQTPLHSTVYRPLTKHQTPLHSTIYRSMTKHQTPLHSTVDRPLKSLAIYLIKFFKRTSNSHSCALFPLKHWHLHLAFTEIQLTANKSSADRHKMTLKATYSSQTLLSCYINRAGRAEGNVW